MSQTLQGPSTGTQQVASGAAGVFPVSYGYYPQEGSRVVNAIYNWSANIGFNEDLSQLVAKGLETTIQSVWIDNSSNPEPVTLSIASTGQVIVVPQNSQGLFPAFFTGAPAFQISVLQIPVQFIVLGVVTVPVTRVVFLNVPCGGASIWSTQAPLQQGGTSRLYDISASQNLFTAARQSNRIARVSVIVTTAVGIISINESIVGALTNDILIIPIGTPAGTVYFLDWPVSNMSSVNFQGGATGTLSISFTNQ